MCNDCILWVVLLITFSPVRQQCRLPTASVAYWSGRRRSNNEEVLHDDEQYENKSAGGVAHVPRITSDNDHLGTSVNVFVDFINYFEARNVSNCEVTAENTVFQLPTAHLKRQTETQKDKRARDYAQDTCRR